MSDQMVAAPGPMHTVADPGPLGLAGFAMTTFCLSAANANLWHGGGAAAALSLALVYGGIAQFAAGMWEFHRRNTFGALAFTSYGAFWISFYVLLKIPAIAPGPDTVAVFLLGWTIFTLYMRWRPAG
jgi:succinate-acetate transporter protein